MTFKLLFIFGDSVISPPPPVAVASAVVTTALLLLWVRCDGRCAHSWRAQGTATLPPNSTSRLRQHCSRWAGGDGGHGAAAAPCSCLSMAPPSPGSPCLSSHERSRGSTKPRACHRGEASPVIPLSRLQRSCIATLPSGDTLVLR